MFFIRRPNLTSLCSSSSACVRTNACVSSMSNMMNMQVTASKRTISANTLVSSFVPLLQASCRFAATSSGAPQHQQPQQQQQQQSFVTPTVFGNGSALGHIVRHVHPKGFLSPLNDTLFFSPQTRKSEEYKAAHKLAVEEGKNLLLTGPANTAKRSVLVELMKDLTSKNERQHNVAGGIGDVDARKRKIALISMRHDRAYSMPEALPTLGFLGLRHVTASTPTDQIASAMLRHIRLMKSAYGSCITTLRELDVLAIDSMEEMYPNVFKAIDNVAREMKGRPDVPFGGMQIIATANFWRMSDIDTSSPHGIYTFQLDAFFKTFPSSQTLLMHRFVHRDTQNLTQEQLDTLNDYTINALFGNLPEDVKKFESFFSSKSLPYRLPVDGTITNITSTPTASSAAASSTSSSKSINGNIIIINSSSSSSSSGKQLASSTASNSASSQTCQFHEYAECVYSMFPSFCRHPAKRERATDYTNPTYRKFQSRFSGWMSSLLVLPSSAGNALGLPHKLNLKVNDPVVFTRDLHEVAEEEEETLPHFANTNSAAGSEGKSGKTGSKNHGTRNKNADDSSSTFDKLSSETIVVRKGALGTIVEVGEFRMKVQLWGGDRRVVSVLPMRVTAHHSTYPTAKESLMQFPLLAARKVYPDALVMLNLAPEALVADARYFTEVNEFGNFLAVLRSPSVFFTHIRSYFERPACIHEAAKNYYDALIEDNSANQQKDSSSLSRRVFGTMPYRSSLTTRLCKNCKSHVQDKDFKKHWLSCVHSCRWCTECSTTVPLEKWEAHNEKHTVVMCLDCGRPLEWRNWALHRNTCGAMIREVSSNNDFLPSVTQQTALQMGVDGRDLHTVKQITKGALPRSGRQISKTHKTAFQYKASGY